GQPASNDRSTLHLPSYPNCTSRATEFVLLRPVGLVAGDGQRDSTFNNTLECGDSSPLSDSLDVLHLNIRRWGRVTALQGEFLQWTMSSPTCAGFANPWRPSTHATASGPVLGGCGTSSRSTMRLNWACCARHLAA